MFTCGLVRSNFAFAMMASLKDALCLAGAAYGVGRAVEPPRRYAYFDWISSEMFCGTGS